MYRAVTCWLAAVLIASCDGQAASPPPPPPRAVQVLTVTPADVRETGAYIGTLLCRESVTVLPQVNGYVRKVHVRPGERVAVGAPLIEVDAREESAALRSASAQAESASTALGLAKKAGARAEALFKDGLIS